jgi:DNA-binding NarL/FixJ family response regulator
MPLTDRDRRILDMLADGKRYKHIGRELGLCETTIRGEVRLICAKLDVPHKVAAVLKYKRS